MAVTIAGAINRGLMSEQSPRDNTHEHVDVQSMYVDGAELYVQPFSMQVVLAAHTLDGRPIPRVHLTMSPTFAHHLRNVLSEGLAVYDRVPAGVELEPPPDDASRE